MAAHSNHGHKYIRVPSVHIAIVYKHILVHVESNITIMLSTENK